MSRVNVSLVMLQAVLSHLLILSVPSLTNSRTKLSASQILQRPTVPSRRAREDLLCNPKLATNKHCDSKSSSKFKIIQLRWCETPFQLISNCHAPFAFSKNQNLHDHRPQMTWRLLQSMEKDFYSSLLTHTP